MSNAGRPPMVRLFFRREEDCLRADLPANMPAEMTRVLDTVVASIPYSVCGKAAILFCTERKHRLVMEEIESFPAWKQRAYRILLDMTPMLEKEQGSLCIPLSAARYTGIEESAILGLLSGDLLMLVRDEGQKLTPFESGEETP